MIQSIYIILESVGCLIDVHSDDAPDTDPQVVMGLLAAFVQLARDMLDESIDEIYFQNTKLVYRRGGVIHLVALLPRYQELSPEIIRCVNDILDGFCDKFPRVGINTVVDTSGFDLFSQWITERLTELKINQEKDSLYPTTIS